MSDLYATRKGDRVAVFRTRGGPVLPGVVTTSTFDHRIVTFTTNGGSRSISFRCSDGIARGSSGSDPTPWRCVPVARSTTERARELRAKIDAMLEPLSVDALEQLAETLAEILPKR